MIKAKCKIIQDGVEHLGGIFFKLYGHIQKRIYPLSVHQPCRYNFFNMYFMDDEQLARMIQFANSPYKDSPEKLSNHKRKNSDIIDSKLEYLDPTPNIHALFVKFDKRFFSNSLGMVEVKWSQKMTTCAGICYYHGKNGLCSISLSAPLLSLRPRKDLVETLLHEMIHAYLFVTENRKDREDHGPEFHKHMHRINKETGTNITVYHSFHDEVEYYLKHIWRCNGPCQHKKPFFGLVRRASNRPPGPNDFWWERHRQECGGTFAKISEPDNFKKPRSKKDSKDPSNGKVSPNIKGVKDIRDFFTPVASSSGSANTPKSNVVTFKDISDDKKPKSGISGMTANKGSGTLVVTQHKFKDKGKTETSDKVKKEPLEKVKKEPKTEKPDQNKNSGCPANCTCKKCSDESKKVKETVRSIWADKFPSSSSVSSKSDAPVNGTKKICPKMKKLDCPVCGKSFPEPEIENHVNHCLENSASNSEINNGVKETDYNVNGNKNDDLVDCPVCNSNVKQNQLNEHLESCLKCSFENEPDEFETDEAIDCKSVPCPCCMKWFLEKEMDAHVDECLTLVALKNGLLDT